MQENNPKISHIEKISTALNRENKKYVIAVANALLFSQKMQNGYPEAGQKTENTATL